MVDDLELIGCLEVLDVSCFDRFNMHTKRAYRTISQQRSSGMGKTVGVMDTRSKEGLRRSYGMRNVELFLEPGRRIRTVCCLVRDG